MTSAEILRHIEVTDDRIKSRRIKEGIAIRAARKVEDDATSAINRALRALAKVKLAQETTEPKADLAPAK